MTFFANQSEHWRAVLFFGVIFLCCAALITGQEKRGQKARKTAVQTSRLTVGNKLNEGSYSVQQFNPAITTLPVKFRGHDPSMIFKRLEERQRTLKKDEFETTESYRQRIQAQASRPFLGVLTPLDIFAFVIDKPESEYDADKQILHLRAKSSSLILGGKGKMSMTCKATKVESAYLGTNAFGTKVRVKQTLIQVYAIEFENYQQFPIFRMDLEHAGFFVDLSLKSQNARNLKENLRFLLVCRMAAPYTTDNTSVVHSATFESPHENILSAYSLNTELLEVWLFDSTTGEVQAKYKPSSS